MKLGVFVSFVDPLFEGKAGKTIETLGQGFTGKTKVSFHGVAATFAVVSDTYLTAVGNSLVRLVVDQPERAKKALDK